MRIFKKGVVEIKGVETVQKGMPLNITTAKLKEVQLQKVEEVHEQERFFGS